MSMPSIKYRSITIEYEKNELKSKFDNGAVLARKKFSKTRKTIIANPTLLTQSNISDLVDHFEEYGTVYPFEWTHPQTLASYTVRFKNPLKYSVDAEISTMFKVDPFQLEEV